MARKNARESSLRAVEVCGDCKHLDGRRCRLTADVMGRYEVACEGFEPKFCPNCGAKVASGNDNE